MKGLNQTLALIVAASVLMMTALIVIFLVTNTIPPTTEEVEVSSCRSLAQSKCSDTSQTINAPTACTDNDGDVPGDVASQVSGLSEDGRLDCSVYQ